MSNQVPFEYQSVDASSPYGDAFVGVLPRGIDGSSQLLESVADALSFPPYFGCNWNALSDCLRDFHWVQKREVVLVHPDLPKLLPGDLKIYLDVLVYAVADWKPNEDHKFRVIFDFSVKKQIGDILAK